MGRFGKFRGKLRGTQGNSVEFSVALNMHSAESPGGFRGIAGFSKKSEVGVVSPQKAFAQIAEPDTADGSLLHSRRDSRSPWLHVSQWQSVFASFVPSAAQLHRQPDGKPGCH